MRWALALVLTASPAWAEVCDKERPSWTPGTQVTVWNDWIYTLQDPFMLGFLFVALGALVIGWRWLPLAMAALTGLLALSMIKDTLFTWHLDVGVMDPVHAAAIREGCIAPPYVTIALFLVLTGALIWRGARMR